MALDDEKLAKTIEEELTASGFKPLLADSTSGHQFWLAIARALNKHQKENAEVVVAGYQGKIR